MKRNVRSASASTSASCGGHESGKQTFRTSSPRRERRGAHSAAQTSTRRMARAPAASKRWHRSWADGAPGLVWPGARAIGCVSCSALFSCALPVSRPPPAQFASCVLYTPHGPITLFSAPSFTFVAVAPLSLRLVARHAPPNSLRRRPPAPCRRPRPGRGPALRPHHLSSSGRLLLRPQLVQAPELPLR